MDAREIIEVRPKDSIDEFQPGDAVTVNLHVREGDRTRVQAFQGNVIAGAYSKDKVPQPGATFTVRRVSYGIGVERVIPFYSPSIESVQVTRKGKVKQARLFYLRGLSGRKARIKEKR